MVQINFYFPPIRKENVQKKWGEKAFLFLKLFTDVFIFRVASLVQWLIDNEIDSH